MYESITAEKAKDMFKRYKKTPKGYYVNCFHGEDENPSLLLTDSTDSSGNHKLLAHCFVCNIDGRTVLNYINQKGNGYLDVELLKQIAAGKKIAVEVKKENAVIQETYPYRDRQGKLIYETVRWKPKDFTCRRPATAKEREETGKEWVWKKDFEPCIYNLDLIDALSKKAPDKYVHVVEGEAKANLLRSVKIVGTCNPFGAGKFYQEYAEDLRNLNVCLLPDNDIYGYNHIYQVAEFLLPVVKSLKFVELPRLKRLKDDVKDWFNLYGGTREELLSLVESAEELKEQTLDYIKETYKFMEEIQEIELEEDDLTALVNVDFTAESYSPKLMEKLEIGRATLEREGPNCGICQTCMNTGFMVGRNDDGYIAVLSETISTGEGDETPQIKLRSCNHGVYDQNIEEFNF